MTANAAARSAAPALGVAPLFVALAAGIGAHLLGSPVGHDGSLRDVLLLVADLVMVAVLAQRGELAPRRLFGDARRGVTIALLAISVAGGLVMLEGAPNGIWELLASSAIIALSALLGAATLVVCAEYAAEAARGAFVAIIRWMRRIETSPSPALKRRRRLDRALFRRERCDVRSRRGPPVLLPSN
jgi:hypothetical protein